MATLLIVIFICYVGLGLPDTLMGSAWPAMYQDLNVPISLNGYISAVVNIGTIISSLSAAKLIKRFGTGWVTAISTLLTTVALFGYALTENPYLFFLFSIPLGLGAGAIDTGLNAFVALHYNAAKMNFLHGSYGVGVVVSPFVMSLALGVDGDWRRGYFIIGFIQLALTIFSFCMIPLWKKWEKRAEQESGITQKDVSLFELLKMRDVRLSAFVFFSQCALELTVGVWCSSFFVTAKGVSESSGAGFTMLYYIGFTIGRFLSGVIIEHIGRRKIIKICISLIGVFLFIFALPLPTEILAFALFFIGLGIGPAYPNMMHLNSKFFDGEIAQSVMGLQQAATYIGVLSMPLLFGVIADWISTSLLPYYLIILLVLYAYSFFALLKEVKRKKQEVTK